jgi:hypothetical protein
VFLHGEIFRSPSSLCTYLCECSPAFKGLWYIRSYQPICLELARLKFCKLVRFNRMFVSDDLHYEWVFPVSQFEERCTNKDYILIIFNVFNTSSENWRRAQFLGIVFRDVFSVRIIAASGRMKIHNKSENVTLLLTMNKELVFALLFKFLSPFVLQRNNLNCPILSLDGVPIPEFTIKVIKILSGFRKIFRKNGK